MHEDDAHDPVDLMIVFQKNLELVQEAGKRIYKLEQQRVQAARTEAAAGAAITLAAEKTKHTAALVDSLIPDGSLQPPRFEDQSNVTHSPNAP